MLKELSKVEQRYDAVVAVIRDGLRVSEAAEKFGVDRDMVYVWLARYEADGLDGLTDRSHRPHASPRQMPAAVEARVLELRRLHPHWGPMSIRYRLGREGLDLLRITGRFVPRYMQSEGEVPSAAWYIVNQFLRRDPAQRDPALGSNDPDVKVFAEGAAPGLVIDTVELFKLWQRVTNGQLDARSAREALMISTGRFVADQAARAGQ